VDIYTTLIIFILENFCTNQNQWHFGLPLAYPQKFADKNFNLRQISDNPRNFIFSKIFRATVLVEIHCQQWMHSIHGYNIP